MELCGQDEGHILSRVFAISSFGHSLFVNGGSGDIVDQETRLSGVVNILHSLLHCKAFKTIKHNCQFNVALYY